MKKRVFVGGTFFAIVGLGIAWLLGWLGPDPALAEVRALQEKMVAVPEMPEAERRALFGEIREKMEQLSPEARQEVWNSSRHVFEQRMEARIDRILAMTPAERVKALDEDIDRMERMRAERERDRAAGGG